MLNNVNIGLFITGGIAAYKMAELSRQLIKKGANVRVVMTAGAREFITPLTLETLTKAKVLTDTFEEEDPNTVSHIHLADWVDIAIVAPATANSLAKMAQGIADDIVTTTLMAVNKPRLIVPAMNTKMYDNPATQRNLQLLASYGYHILEPATGFLAEGYEGKGRLPELEVIVQHAEVLYAQHGLPQLLADKHVLVTAGGTVERIDPVRYISNDSSGQMGYAMAEAARNLGAKVTLISTKPNLKEPVGVTVNYVHSAMDLQATVNQHFDQTDIVVMAAAVSDYRVATPSDHKLKKEANQSGDLTLQLIQNPDILKGLSQSRTHQLLVGFAAETQDVYKYAQTKLESKGIDWVIANDVSRSDRGFNSKNNEVIVMGADGTVQEIGLQDKGSLAREIWRVILNENDSK